LNRRPLGYEGIFVIKVNRSEPRKAKLEEHLRMPSSDPSRFSLVAVHAQNPAQLEPQPSRRPDGELVWRRASRRRWPQGSPDGVPFPVVLPVAGWLELKAA